jgi:hypothetical protein
MSACHTHKLTLTSSHTHTHIQVKQCRVRCDLKTAEEAQNDADDRKLQRIGSLV